MKKINLLLHLFIIPVFVVELISCRNNNYNLDYFTKPWLLIWIGFYFFLNTRTIRKDLFIYFAFFFSWIGDLFLLAAHTDGVYFYAGVGGFFLAQLSYILAFTNTTEKGYLAIKPLWLIPFLLYLSGMLYLISGGMKGIMIPIIVVYAISLISMSAAALNRKNLACNKSFYLVFLGSVLFVISDSMIAINKFYMQFDSSSFLIMLTYFTAQYMIMQGLIAEDKSHKIKV